MSDEVFLQFYEKNLRAGDRGTQMAPRSKLDFRFRVRREELRGRWGIFYNTLEEYLYRHMRAYTVPRAFIFWIGSIGLFINGIHKFEKTFPNIRHYGKFKNHPNYKLLGSLYANFYRIRPIFWGWIAYRLTRWFSWILWRWYVDGGDPHYFWYYDNLYPDMIGDPDDMRYLNFQYIAHPVTPDEMNGYFPWDKIKYQKFVDSKASN